MDFLGIGSLELALIVLIALIVLGPSDMVRFARKAARSWQQLRSSCLWSELQGTQLNLKRAATELISLPEDAGAPNAKREPSAPDSLPASPRTPDPATPPASETGATNNS